VDPKQAWNAVLGQLQMEMAKATFDTWVKDTEFIAYEDSTFLIGVANAYTRDWLDSRLTSTVTGLLAGMIDSTVDVRFVVWQDNHQESLGDVEKQTDIPLRLELNYSNAYQKIVQPNRVVIAPAYLFRHIHHLGPTGGMILLAFYQLVYLCHKEEGKGIEQSSYNIETAAATIARWAGISKATFWREFYKNKYLGHFVRATRQFNPETSGQEENVWTVQVEMPLTPEDQNSLRTWLVENKISSHPIDTLNQALKASRDQIIPDKWKEYQRGDGFAPATVNQVVMSLIDFETLSPTEQKVLEVLVNSLREHLQRKDGRKNDLLITTWYFMKEVVPLVGCGPAWAILYLRDHTFGVLRKSVTVPGGWKELAARLGISTPNTVAKWFKLPVIGTELYKKYASKQEINWKMLYAKAIDEQKQPNQQVAVTFEVQPFDFVSLKHIKQLLTESELSTIAVRHKTALHTQIDSNHNKGRKLTQKKEYLSEGILKFDQQESALKLYEVSKKQGELDFETGVMIGELDSETGLLVGDLESEMGVTIGQLDFETGILQRDLDSQTGSELVFETLLNTLFKLLSGNLISIDPKTSDEDINTPSESLNGKNVSSQAEEIPIIDTLALEERIPEDWNLDYLVDLVGVSPISIAEMKAIGVTAQDWVACILYYNNADQNLNSPFRMAIKHLTNNLPRVGRDYKKLASLPPRMLVELILWQLEPNGDSEPDEVPLAWKRTMAKTSAKKIRQVLDTLVDYPH
jgi:hypothetical protein